MRMMLAAVILFILVGEPAYPSVAQEVAQEGAEVADLPSIDRIVVHKSLHQLDAFSGGQRVARFQVAIGGGGVGPKLYAGDRRTPEGIYRIDRRHHSRRFHRFLHISYPNRADRRRWRDARRQGLVPRGRGVGSAIGLHGATRGLSLLAPNVRWNWTDGCLAVSNAEIERLYDSVVDDAVIEILP